MLLSSQLSQKGSLHLDGQVATPASVSSTDASSQQADAATSGHNTKMEVKQQDDDDEDDDEDMATGGRIGKLGNVKTEEKPDVRIMWPYFGSFSVY